MATARGLLRLYPRGWRERYGEDYARMIKLYFEQIADTRRPR